MQRATVRAGKPINALQAWLWFPLVILAVSLVLQLRGTYAPLNDRLLNYRMEQTTLPASGDVGVIAIDSKSLKSIGTWPWSRSVHAQILDRLVDHGAGAVFYDVDFAFPADAEGDQAFIEALDRAGGATLLATFMQIGLDGERVYNQPHAPFHDRSWPAAVTVTPNASGVIRNYPTGTTIDGVFVPSAAVQLAGSFASEATQFTVNFGIPHQTIPTFSAIDLLDGSLARDDIAGRTFLIGAATAELGDHFSVPLQRVIPGVLIHAIATETLLQNATISHVPWIYVLPVLLALTAILYFVGKGKAWPLIASAVFFGLTVEAAALWMFQSGFNNAPTALLHPALLAMVLGRLVRNVDVSRFLIKRQSVDMLNAERLHQHIFENSSDGFLAVNSGGEVVFQSDKVGALLGTGKLPPAIITAAQQVMQNPEAKPRLDYLELDGQDSTTSLEMHANASAYQRLDSHQNLVDEPLALITLRDVTDLKAKEKQIAYLSRHDERTTALRRHSFQDAITSRLNAGDDFAVVAIALGRLTAINATLGRDIGDQVLVGAVRRLRDSAFRFGEVARLEGNVLGVIIPEVSSEAELQEDCRRLHKLLTRTYHLNESQVQIGLSIGYILADNHPDWTADDYLSGAQDALAKARQTSSGTAIGYDSADSERLARARKLEHALNQALERQEFHLLYQPQYRLSDRTLVGAEALIRWDSPEFGNVRPDEFIPIAESSGFITDLGNFVLDTSIKAAANLPAHVVISPNVSAIQLLSDALPNQVKTLMARHNLSPDRLCLELTESEYLQPDSDAVQRMKDIQALGVSWALDDFGTGYSSLSYLKDLPFEKIKLDRAFLRNLTECHETQTTVQSLIQLVHGYGKTILCEGVETEEEADLLTALGCDSVQGYVFGRPASLAELQSRLAA